MKPKKHQSVKWHERRVTIDELRKALNIPEEEFFEQISPASEDGMIWRVVSYEEPVEE